MLRSMGRMWIVDGVGRVRRLVRSKLWQNAGGKPSSDRPGGGFGGLRAGDGGAVFISMNRD